MAKIIDVIQNKISKLTDRTLCLIICFMGVLVYAHSLDVPFYYDDFSYILNNPMVHKLWGVFDKAYIAQATVDYADVKMSVLTRPLPYFTFAINYYLHQTSVAGYHIINIMIHLLNSLLMFSLALLLCQSLQLSSGCQQETAKVTMRWIALFTALLFAVHPVMVNTVTCIFQRAALLATFFYLLTIVLYLCWYLSPGRLATRVMWYVSAFISCLLSMKCKEIALTLPFMLIMTDSYFCVGNLKKRCVRLLPFLILIAIIPMTRISMDSQEVFRTSNEMPSTLFAVSYVVKSPLSYFTTQFSTNINQTSITSMSPLEYLFTQFRVIVTYQKMLFVPVGLNFLHDYPFYRTLAEPQVFISVLFHAFVMSIACYMFRLSRRSEYGDAVILRLASFGLFWFYLALVVECSILPIDDHFHEYRMYLPAFGVISAIVSIILIVVRKARSRETGLVFSSILLVIVVVIFSILTIRRNEQWRDPLVFWQDALVKSPNKHRIHGYIGNVYRERGNMAGALREYREMLAHDFRYGQDHYGLGEELLKNGYYAEAVEEYLVALKIRPDKTFVYKRLAEAYHLLGDDSRAEDARRKAATGNKLIGNEQGVW